MKYPGLAAILFLLYSLPTLANECTPVSKKMAAEIARQVEQFRAVEACESRHVYKEMGVELVLFSLKGACATSPDAAPGSCGDKSAVYLAGVLSGQVLPAIEVSDERGFAPIKVRKEGEAALVTGLKHAPTDPLCCPSVRETRPLKITPTGFQP